MATWAKNFPSCVLTKVDKWAQTHRPHSAHTTSSFTQPTVTEHLLGARNTNMNWPWSWLLQALKDTATISATQWVANREWLVTTNQLHIQFSFLTTHLGLILINLHLFLLYVFVDIFIKLLNSHPPLHFHRFQYFFLWLRHLRKILN